MLPKPPPMSFVTKRSLSSPVRSAGAIQIAPMPGIWWLQWSVHCPVGFSYSTTAPEHSSGVELKRWKWSSLIVTIRSASAFAPSQSPQSKTPLQTVFVPASSCMTVSSLTASRASTSTSSGSYSTSTSSAASRASSRVAAHTAATGSPMNRTLPTASA